MAQFNQTASQSLFTIEVGRSQERDNNEEWSTGIKMNSIKTRSFPVHFFLILNLESSEIWDAASKQRGLLIASLELVPQAATSSLSWERWLHEIPHSAWLAMKCHMKSFFSWYLHSVQTQIKKCRVTLCF